MHLEAECKVKVLSKYEVKLISIKDKDELMEKYEDRFLYEERADIYGCCIKLLTDIKYVKERWEENFYPMSAHVRSHGCRKGEDFTAYHIENSYFAETRPRR